MEHIPVMPGEALSLLAIRPAGVYVDATAGVGGHTRLIAERLSTGLVIANDRDAESLEIARRNTEPWAARIRFHQGTFGELGAALAEAGCRQADGLLADLGVSRQQLLSGERGFSFLMDGPLDMRLDRTSQRMTAADLVNHAAERELADLIFRFGGERRARRAARAIVRARPLRSTLHLASVVARAVPRTSGLHPATRTFMALRVAVNDEPGELDRLLAIAPSLIARGGRMAIISFSSLEDGQIKRKFRAYEKAGGAAVLTKHPLRPGRAEVTRNPAARSAKLRALEIV